MVINLISSPRNISTALMYAFANRKDTKVMDEPFYAYYLNLTGADHPGKKEIIASQPTSVSGVRKWIDQLNAANKIVFVKNMAHHLIEMDTSFLCEYVNVFLIRDPKELITSFAKVIAKPTMSDIGVKRQSELFDFLARSSIVIDSNEVLKSPKYVLTSLCEKVNIPFDNDMLNWPQGPLPEDGVWAKYWYGNVHASTGFSQRVNKNEPLPPNCIELYEESLPYFQKLHKKAIKALD